MTEIIAFVKTGIISRPNSTAKLIPETGHMSIYASDYCPPFRESDMIHGPILSWLFMNWSVYIIEANDNSYYTGIATDVKRRFKEHGGTVCGAKYFNGRTPLKVIYQEDGHTRSSASKREVEIKKLSRLQKELLITGATQ